MGKWLSIGLIFPLSALERQKGHRRHFEPATAPAPWSGRARADGHYHTRETSTYRIAWPIRRRENSRSNTHYAIVHSTKLTTDAMNGRGTHRKAARSMAQGAPTTGEHANKYYCALLPLNMGLSLFERTNSKG